MSNVVTQWVLIGVTNRNIVTRSRGDSKADASPENPLQDDSGELCLWTTSCLESSRIVVWTSFFLQFGWSESPPPATVTLFYTIGRDPENLPQVCSSWICDLLLTLCLPPEVPDHPAGSWGKCFHFEGMGIWGSPPFNNINMFHIYTALYVRRDFHILSFDNEHKTQTHVICPG